MATVAQLAAREYQEIAYLFVVEGWPVAFCNRLELVGSGESSWIGTDDGARTVALGLEPPSAVKLGVGIVETGMPIDDAATFTIVDRDDHMIGLMVDDDGALAYERVDATSPAPSTVNDGSGGTINPRGKWINGEAIGDDGERRLYPILPGVTLPGYDHAAINSQDTALRASKIRDAARWLEGLPCALYVIRKDIDAGTWPSWADQHASGYSLLWWGSLRAATAESHAWTLSCDGPSSWLRRTLNVTMPAEWSTLGTYLALRDDQARFAVALMYGSPVDPFEACAVSAYTASDTLTSGATPAELALEINTRIQTLVAAAGDDATFTDWGGAVTFTPSGVSIKVDDNNASSPGNYALAGFITLRMSKLAWLHLGWDLVVQHADRATWAKWATVYEVDADTESGKLYPLGVDPVPDYGPDYWGATFCTHPLGVDGFADKDKVDGEGMARPYAPVYGQGNSVTVLYPEAEQVVVLAEGVGFGGQFNIGQLALPPADVDVAGAAADRAGFIAFRGPFRASLDDEPVERYALARVSWQDASNTVAADDQSRAVAWVEEWLDPRLWGCKDPKFSQPWAVGDGDVEWCPIALLGYNAGQGGADRADLVLLRLLLSSGTAAWTGVGDAATIADGDNDHASATGAQSVGNDREVADLGLCIPQQMIEWSSFVAAADALPGGKSGGLNRCRLAYVGPFDAQETIESIITPRGWCFSLKSGKYGLFARHVPLDAVDVEVALTAAHVAADPSAGPPAESVDFRPLEPVDLVAVQYGATQLGGGEGRDAELTVKARDPRAAARRGNARVEIDGRALLPPKPLGVAESVSPLWINDFSKLWGEELARFYGEPHAMVTVAIKGDTARDLWPGTIVSYTSAWPATRNGVYGMQARVGRVVSVSRDLMTLAATCEILVEGKDPLTVPRFAPVARLVDDHANDTDRYNAATRTLYCEANAFGREGSESDVAAFVEPAWSTAGGQAVAHLWQSADGQTWAHTATFSVESVSTAASTITYAAGTLSGTIWEKRYGIIVLGPYADQDAESWPLSVLGVVCDVDDLHGAGDVAGKQWAP